MAQPSTIPLIISPLGVVPKADGSFRRIHDLSCPPGASVNDAISKDYATLCYVTLQEILSAVLDAGAGCLIWKRDLADAFRHIPLARQISWLFGFRWKDVTYVEHCLVFGLRTAPFIFNLFAEALHWILLSWLELQFLFHYLDDFIHIIPKAQATPAYLYQLDEGYILITDLLGILRKDTKNESSALGNVLGYLIDTDCFILSVPPKKVSQVGNLTTLALQEKSLSLQEAQVLAGFLSFCAPAVQLGWVFCRPLWNYIASFPPNATKFHRKRLPQQVKDDILWWNTLLQSFNGTMFFFPSRPQVQLFTDACSIGIGGFYFESEANSTWQPAAEQGLIKPESTFACALHDNTAEVLDINIFEMQAVLAAITLFSAHFSGKEVCVHTDNFTTMSGLSRHQLASPC